MQLIFYTEHSAAEFSTRNSSLYPEPPQRCPFKNCALPVKLRKHGYYTRYFVSKTFSGILYIRRYICPFCGRTAELGDEIIARRKANPNIPVTILYEQLVGDGLIDPLNISRPTLYRYIEDLSIAGVFTDNDQKYVY